ncbi:MAG TPA: aromatic amino acid hydroxylase [Polyangiales bacterium]|nr:aromatic amino acid hydroxylase [Polyangiales bacterium]
MQLPAQLPAHLRQFVVTQDYSAYNAEDQAVWRFVVLQTHARLLQTAHPAYAAGFAAVGISVEEIPRIERMNEHLADCGFQAICVDGFIPPRAFQAFQGRGFLPIAADIRTSQHLTYTPAPDIIHEAAGHAPFLAHADFARYLRDIGRFGEQAFSSPYDRDVYEAIHSLSELKEDPQVTAAQIQAAEERLNELTRTAAAPSEAALLSRLYWWTVEYGLVGDVNDYRLYGAGLLSSIGEGHFCHEPEVKKLPLQAACIQVPYDITRPQPQLFVARDFEHLHEVLDEVCEHFAFRIGGSYALEQAQLSGEPATLELGDGAQLAGVVSELHYAGAELAAVSLQGECALAHDDTGVTAGPRLAGYVLPLGRLEDGTSLSMLSAKKLRALTDGHGRIRLRTQQRVMIEGRVVRYTERGGRVVVLDLADCTLSCIGEVLLRSPGPYPLVLAERVMTAHAALPLGYFPATELRETKIPRQREFPPAHAKLIELYEEALGSLREGFGGDVLQTFERIHEALEARYPDDWLLRWNLLESLAKLGKGAALGADLTRELERLELRYAHREPIATGLAYVRSLYRTEGP